MDIARLHDHCLFGLIQVPFSRPAILSVATRVQAGSEQSTNFRGLVRVLPLLAVLPAFGESKRAHFWLSPAIWLSVWLSSALCEFSDCTMRFISAVRALSSERIHHGIRQLRLQPQTLLYLAAGRADWPLAKRFTGHIICASPDEDADSLSCSFSMQTTVLFSLPRLSAWSFFYRLIKPALLLPWIYQKTTPIRTCLGRSSSHHLQHEYRVLLKFIR
jgi:hypothetical protein